MARLIDAEALSESIRNGSGTALQKFFADVCVATAPTVDAAPVVHGRWKDGHCTNCYHPAEVQSIGFNCVGDGVKANYNHTNYCPNCGAKMDLKEG